MDVKGDKSSYNFFNKSKLRNRTKTFLETKFFSLFLVKFKKLGFSAPLMVIYTVRKLWQESNRIRS